MSSPAQGGPSVPAAEKKPNISSKILTRVKTIIKRAEKRISFSGSKAGPSTAVKTEYASSPKQPHCVFALG